MEKNVRTESLDEKSYKRLFEMLRVLRKNNILKGITPVKLRTIIEELGPMYVKFGQMISTSTNILPNEFCVELMKLHSKVKPLPFSQIKDIIEEEYRTSISDVFLRIEENPIGSASIAQVYKATLRNGEEVVVKVQRPNIKETMAKDIKLLKRALKILNFVTKTGDIIDFEAMIDELWSVSQKEMDFLLEADNCERFFEANKDCSYVSAPKVIKKYTTSKMLVMEYIDGIDIIDTQLLEENGYDLNEIGEKLGINYVKQVIKDGFFHADPHPGNLKIREGEIVFIDLGMVGEISNHERNILKNIVTSIVTNDIYAVKNGILTLGIVKGTINHTKLYSDIDDMLLKYGEMDLANLNISIVIQDLIELMKQHNISIPSNFTMLERGIITLEGVLKSISPEINYMKIISSYISGEKKNTALTNRFEWKQMLLSLSSFIKTNEKIPKLISDLLKLNTKGQMKVKVEMTTEKDLFYKIEHLVDKMVLCIICASLLIASSLLCTTHMKPEILGIPALGMLGYIGALILGILLIHDLLKDLLRKK